MGLTDTVAVAKVTEAGNIFASPHSRSGCGNGHVYPVIMSAGRHKIMALMTLWLKLLLQGF